MIFFSDSDDDIQEIPSNSFDSAFSPIEIEEDEEEEEEEVKKKKNANQQQKKQQQKQQQQQEQQQPSFELSKCIAHLPPSPPLSHSLIPHNLATDFGNSLRVLKV